VERHARSYCSESFSLNVAQDAGQMQTILSLVAAAMGIALIPSSVPNLCSDGACTSLVMLTIEFD
jgi:DNA-binding transcriptional LysR family regulator